ncbi:hypothetical protein Tsubulata_046283, partial [Turnera subulata]
LFHQFLSGKKGKFHKLWLDTGPENKQEMEASLHEDETWRPLLKRIHPACFAPDCYFRGWRQYILLLCSLGCILSMLGCYQHHKRVGREKVDNVESMKIV